MVNVSSPRMPTFTEEELMSIFHTFEKYELYYIADYSQKFENSGLLKEYQILNGIDTRSLYFSFNAEENSTNLETIYITKFRDSFIVEIDTEYLMVEVVEEGEVCMENLSKSSPDIKSLVKDTFDLMTLSKESLTKA
jgi:hypothetical protein